MGNPTPALPPEIERELVCGGFAWERKPGKPISFRRMKKQRKGRGKRARIAPSQTPAAVYKREQRARWIAMGIVKPRTPEEHALAQVAAVAEKWLLGRAA